MKDQNVDGLARLQEYRYSTKEQENQSNDPDVSWCVHGTDEFPDRRQVVDRECGRFDCELLGFVTLISASEIPCRNEQDEALTIVERLSRSKREPAGQRGTGANKQIGLGEQVSTPFHFMSRTHAAKSRAAHWKTTHRSSASNDHLGFEPLSDENEAVGANLRKRAGVRRFAKRYRKPGGPDCLRRSTRSIRLGAPGCMRAQCASANDQRKCGAEMKCRDRGSRRTEAYPPTSGHDRAVPTAGRPPLNPPTFVAISCSGVFRNTKQL